MHPRLGKKVARGAALLAALVAVGCGKTGATMTDGWDASPDALSARRAFDLVATLRSDGGSTALPPTNAFTLVTDPATRSAIVGGGGRGAVVPLSTSDGKTFRWKGRFTVGQVPTACEGLAEVDYEELELTLSDRGLTGRASGVAGISCGDCLYVVPFEATVSGTLDATAPVLIPSETPRTPFDSFRVVASEPLPATASARLIADDGAAIDLVPVVIDGAIPIVVGFSKPDVVLRAGHGYDVDVTGIVDFAGQTARSGPPVGISPFQEAPLVAQDGFESATGAMVGDAFILTGYPIPAITGTTSLYIGAPPLVPLAGSLWVKLSRPASATSLRFSYRVVGADPQPSFDGTLKVGSEGGGPGTSSFLSLGSDTSDVVTIGDHPIYLGAVATQAVPLPADAGDEVLLTIVPRSSVCGPVRYSEGLLIDDLRLE